jgi:UDP-glucose:(heptosyl)LPS alpha-1,3-glucosyltransferase
MSQKLRIALAFPGCHRRAGVERILFECAHFLAGRGHDITVFANEWDADPEYSFPYRHVPIRKQPAFLQPRSFFEECSRALDLSEFDVLSAHGCVSPLGGVYWCQSVHPSWLERSAQFRAPLSPARLKQRLNPLHKVLLQLEEKHLRERNYRKIVATTPEVKTDLNRFYDVPPEDVVVIPNGFAPKEFNPQRRLERRDEMRAQLKLAPDKVALLFVANELERKGYHTILEALKILREPRLQVLAIGRFDADEAKRLAQQAGVEKQVSILGSTRDVSGFHAAADVFVLPTQYEAFSLAILEALGSGLPVVTTRIPGANDAIQHEINGLVIEDPNSGEQLAQAFKIMLDDDRRAAITAQVPATSEPYQWPRVLARYEDVLREAAK